MLHLYSKKSLYGLVALCAGVFSLTELQGVVTSLDRYDPFKVYSAIDPEDFLLERKKLYEEGTSWWDQVGNHCKISVSGYFQSADSGKPFDGGDIRVESAIDGQTSVANTIGFEYVPLLDLTGRTPMIPLVMSTSDAAGNAIAPQGAVYAPVLITASEQLFNSATPPPPLIMPNPATPPIPNVEAVIDPAEKFGFFSLPSKYQKRGARADVLINLFGCVGMHLKGGFASISHTPKPPINLTCETTACPFEPPIANYPGVTKDNVNRYLMNDFDCIIKEIGMSNKTYQRTGLEELLAELYWRYPFSLNQNREDWLQILAIPYVEGGFAYSPADAVNTNELYGHMFGNNTHWAAGIAAGFCLDFLSTVEIGGEIGYTHFFANNFDCFRLPNSKLQNNIFPFTTSVNVQPGHNMHYAVKLTARNFLERLSGYFQFVALEHAQDCITLNKQDPAFVPEALARSSGFKVKVANLGLTYPLTPNFLAGFMWQAPLSQRGAARTTTIMLGLTGSF